MSIASDGRSAEVFEIGRVLNRTFGAIGRNPALFLGLMLPLATIPRLIGGLWRAHAGAVGTPGAPVVAFAASMLLSLIGGAMFEAAVTRATVADLASDRPGFAACLRTGIAMTVPMIGMSIVGLLGLFLATLLLIIPGVMLYVAWAVVVPAFVQERIGVLASFGRSRALTKGARWKIFALLLVWWVAAIALQAPVALLDGALRTPPHFPATPSYLQVLFSSAITPVTLTVVVALKAAIYVELREVREGASREDLETIFA